MLKRFCCLLLCLLLIIPNVAYANSISVSATSAIAMDMASQKVLYSKNAYDERAIASTTKIMTCLLACESGMLNKTVVVTDKMVSTDGSSIYLEQGDKILFSDLIKGAMLASGNDAANAIALTMSKSIEDFATLMNNRAKQLGMYNTTFVTPSGLDEGNHHSTAYDMAILASTAIQNKLFASICKMKSAQITINSKKTTIYNHNKLLSYSDDFVGVKTGYTDKAGRCLVSAYNYQGNTIICVTLNDYDDWNDHKRLVEYAKDCYSTVNSEDTFNIDVVGGVSSTVSCTSSYNVTCLNDINIKTYYYPFAYAPVKKGDVLGKQIIYSNNKIIKEVPILASQGISICQTTK